MGITPISPACTQKRCPEPRLLPSLSLSVLKEFIPGGKNVYSKQIAEMIMEEQLVMALVSPQTTVQVCLHKCLHYWGRDG